LVVFVACGGQSNVPSSRDENLEKLARVWGFAKYTHHSFISGQMDWDRELLNLIPIIYYADAEDVNGILYGWFTGLGEDGFDGGGLEFGHDFNLSNYLAMLAAEVAIHETFGWGDEDPMGILMGFREFIDFFETLLADGYDPDWPTFVALGEEVFPDFFVELMPSEGERRPMADLSWINYEYLGTLAAHLLRFDGIIAVDRAAAPVFFNNRIGTPNFSNQSFHADMDFSDTGYRLLGLFRLWNAMKYYFPHLDVIDVQWNDLLIEFIPVMLEGTDRLSYELTLAAMTYHLHDAHIGFAGTTFFTDTFGQYRVPVRFVAAEGRLVVAEIFDAASPLIRGDVIVSLNGMDIEDRIARMRQYLSYPTDEKVLEYLSTGWWSIPTLSSHTRNIEIAVLRNGTEMSFGSYIGYWTEFPYALTASHVLLDNNIGLINPAVAGNVHSIMDEFAQTYGMIIDMRQRPARFEFFMEMRQYLMEDPLPFAYISLPSHTHPGMRVDEIITIPSAKPPCLYL
jgi:hypothetical protein